MNTVSTEDFAAVSADSRFARVGEGTGQSSCALACSFLSKHKRLGQLHGIPPL